MPYSSCSWHALYPFTKFTDRQSHMDALLILAHAPIRIVYIYIFCGMFVVTYIKFSQLWLKQEDKSIERKTKDKLWHRGQTFIVTTESCSEIDHLSCEKIALTHLGLVDLTAGWQTEHRWSLKV